MLVLTRRKKQRVLFPNIGVSIQILDITGRETRLGIDAPKQIRILRGELNPHPEPSVNNHGPALDESSDSLPINSHRHSRLTGASIPVHFDDENDDSTSVEVLTRHLDAANLAIHLAQNQLQQGHNEYAEISLQHAIDCLQVIEISAGLIPTNELSSVRETSSEYRFSNSSKRENAIVMGGESIQREKVASHLSNLGIEVSPNYTSPLDSIIEMQGNENIDLAVFVAAPGCDPIEPLMPITMGRVPSLLRISSETIAGCSTNVWRSHRSDFTELVPNSN